jgi:hypothetical protein
MPFGCKLQLLAPVGDLVGSAGHMVQVLVGVRGVRFVGLFTVGVEGGAGRLKVVVHGVD